LMLVEISREAEDSSCCNCFRAGANRGSMASVILDARPYEVPGKNRRAPSPDASFAREFRAQRLLILPGMAAVAGVGAERIDLSTVKILTVPFALG
jgi:hypothetical protein